MSNISSALPKLPGNAGLPRLTATHRSMNSRSSSVPPLSTSKMLNTNWRMSLSV